MPNRVLSTDQARVSIMKMRQILHGPLLDQLTVLNREGQTLSDLNVWDGRMAQQFRNEWPELIVTLGRVKDQLEQLRSQVDQINENITSAGGNY